jgi:hypothetical protein
MVQPELDRTTIGRPRMPEDVRAKSRARTEAIRIALAKNHEWNVTKLARAVGLSREALNHIVRDRVICPEAIFRKIGGILGFSAEGIDGSQALLIDSKELLYLLRVTSEHPALSALSRDHKNELAVCLADSLKTDGLTPSLMKDHELNHHLLLGLSRLVGTPKHTCDS